MPSSGCAPAAGPRRLRHAHPAQPARLGHGRPPPARGLVEIARRHGLLIIEDASYAYLAEEPPPPLAALAPEITVYVSGLSKSVATGLRVGFVSAPAALVPAIERAIRATTWNTPAITTAIACRWLDDGTVEPPRGRQARRRQSPAGNRPRRPRGPAAGRPPVVLLRVAAAARGRSRRPDSGARSRASASRSPPPNPSRPPRPRRRRFGWPWARPTSAACARR